MSFVPDRRLDRPMRKLLLASLAAGVLGAVVLLVAGLIGATMSLADEQALDALRGSICEDEQHAVAMRVTKRQDRAAHSRRGVK